MSTKPAAKVRRELIAACMTCPLCQKLLREATAVSECLHTFCRRCIRKKLSDEDLECCPICDIDLGCVPLEKLRPDHNLQDVMAKIFPFKRRKVMGPEVMPSVTMPVRRKEISLSSLVVSTPKVSNQRSQSTMIGRRTKVLARRATALQKALEKHEGPVDFAIGKPFNNVEDPSERISLSETHTKCTQNIRQQLSTVEPSGCVSPNEETKNGLKSLDAKVDLWNPLNCLVEVANRTKSFQSSSQGSTPKPEHKSVHEGEVSADESKIKEHIHQTGVHDEKNSNVPMSPELVKPRKLRRGRPKKLPPFGNTGISLQVVLDAAAAKWERRVGPIWFSLVATEDQQGDAPLPQISANYLRVKDGSLPVSVIQKYLMRKLNLKSEADVEIKCMGQPVLPELHMHNLIDLWMQTSEIPKRMSASIGSPAKDFVMVLSYARKPSAPE